MSIPEKKAFLLQNDIALWDTIHSCDIIGSSDSSIKNVIPSDINLILSYADIKAVFCNGATSHKLYMKYCYPSTKRAAVKASVHKSGKCSMVGGQAHSRMERRNIQIYNAEKPEPFPIQA